MPHWLIDCMIYLGSLLMVYNIYGFIRYARTLKKREDWRKQNAILYVPIIALSANAYESDIRKSLEAGMNAHLSKPIVPEMMYETLARLISENSRI